MPSIRDSIVLFNNTFPLDKKHRDKTGVLFGSEQHRSLDQIDLYYSFVEEELYKEAMEIALEEREKEKQLANGIIIRKREPTKEETDALFDKIKLNFHNIK